LKGVLVAKGFTTGTAAAAAAVAAVRFMQDRNCARVTLKLPGSNEIVIPITGCQWTENGAEAWVTRDAGDTPDAANGAVVVSSVEIKDEAGITVLGGTGVGVVTKTGLALPLGRAAINPGPIALIRKSLEGELPSGKGANVSISIPNGEELAKRTHQPRLGIVGGLPITGATGIISRLSDNELTNAIKYELTRLSESGASIVCIVPGNYGRRMAMLLGVPDVMIVNINNMVGEALSMVGNLGFEKLVMIGQIGKFSKVAAGSLDTHISKSDGRLETLAAYSALHGADREAVAEILSGTMADEVAARIVRTDWGLAALRELTERIVKVSLSVASGISECAGLAFSLPDRELARTPNLGAMIEEIKESSQNLS
jgi:cobalt-precorrin-5B (C1)-methyltransferase